MTAETRTRIRETAQRLGFRPNSLAQSLLRRRSFTVGLLTNDTLSPRLRRAFVTVTALMKQL